MKTSMNIADDLYGRMKSKAEREGRTMSWFIRKGLERMLGDSDG